MSIKVHPEKVLDTLGVDNYRINENKVYLLLYDWCKVARHFDKKIVPGCECFWAIEHWWLRASKDELGRWEDSVGGYDP